MNEQPDPGGLCDTCGHFAMRHDEDGCHGVNPEKGCRFGTKSGKPCKVLRWGGIAWPRPWDADGRRVPESPTRPRCDCVGGPHGGFTCATCR